jgi:hypothetical protein
VLPSGHCAPDDRSLSPIRRAASVRPRPPSTSPPRSRCAASRPSSSISTAGQQHDVVPGRHHGDAQRLRRHLEKDVTFEDVILPSTNQPNLWVAPSRIAPGQARVEAGG